LTATATRVAELQQHRAAAGVAEPKATPDDAAPVKPVSDAAAADATPAGGVRNAFCGGAAAAEAMDQDDAADTFAAGAVLPPPRPRACRRLAGPELAGRSRRVPLGPAMMMCATATRSLLAAWRAPETSRVPPPPTTRPWICFARAGTTLPLPLRLSGAMRRVDQVKACRQLQTNIQPTRRPVTTPPPSPCAVHAPGIIPSAGYI